MRMDIVSLCQVVNEYLMRIRSFFVINKKLRSYHGYDIALHELVDEQVPLAGVLGIFLFDATEYCWHVITLWYYIILYFVKQSFVDES